MEEKKQNKKSRGNGQGSVYKLPNGKWRAAVVLGYDGQKKICKTKSGFRTKKEALAHLPILKETKPEIDQNIKFKNIYEEWSESHYQRISNGAKYGYIAAYKYCHPLYFKKFTELKTSDLQKVVDACEFQRRSKADIKSLFNNLYKYAIENDYCNKNYATFVKLPPKEKSKKDSFTKEERDKFWVDYNNGQVFTGYILIMIYTGMRYGEMTTIKKENVFLDKKYMIGGIKTEAGIDREIPICDKILPIVSLFYSTGKKKLLEMSEKVFYNNFYETLKRLKIRRLTPHACRHSAATALAELGIPPAIIKEILGHKEYSTTLGYTHISLSEKLKAVNKME